MNTKFVQVGWYCNHEDEITTLSTAGSTHMSSHGKSTRKGYVETYPQPSTSKSLHFLNHKDPKREPHCQRAVPVYIEEVTR